MVLLDISIQSRVIIGISAMLLLFGSFLLAFVSHQRKKLQYHKKLQAIQQQQQEELRRQNVLLEQRVTERTAELQLRKALASGGLRVLYQSIVDLADGRPVGAEALVRRAHRDASRATPEQFASPSDVTQIAGRGVIA